MSVAHDRRTAHDALALGLAGLALVLVAALLAHGGAVGTVRTVVACLAILVVPGWLVGRLVDEDGDAIARLAGGTVATLGVIALSGFLAVELGVRVATAAVAIPLLVLVAIAAVLGASGPSRSGSAPWRSSARGGRTSRCPRCRSSRPSPSRPPGRSSLPRVSR